MAVQNVKRSTAAPVLPDKFKSRPPGVKLVTQDKLVVPPTPKTAPAPPKPTK